jgi:DNA/RNA endonuclease YhcR with UshA esterase domain
LILVFALFRIGGGIFSFFTPSASRQASQLPVQVTPKVVETDTQVVIFQDPLIDQPGNTVKEITENQRELLGKEVIVKGEVKQTEKDWGFWIEDTGTRRHRIFITTNSALVQPNLVNFATTGFKYIKIKGTVKEMLWTKEATLEEASNSSDIAVSQTSRLVVIPTEIVQLTP